MARLWQRHRLFVVGAIVVVAATAVMLLFARDKGFYVGDVAVNPRAPVDDGHTYELIVWDESIVIPWAAKTQSETLTDGIRSFQQLRPNAAVSYSIIDPAEAGEKLAAALDTGTPPDVYGTARGAVWHPRYTVPASPYLQIFAEVEGSEEGRGPLLPAAARMLQRDDVVWGWPRGLWWQGWLVPADGTGLRFEEGDPAPVGHSAAVNVLDVGFLEQWMAAAGAPSYTDADGTLLWTEADLGRAARGLRELQRTGLLPATRKAPEVARSRVEALLTGTVQGIGPAGPHLAQAVFRHAPDRFGLAAPVGFVPLEISAYFVFRHAKYEGDAHTRLAAELASHLADYTEQWLVESLGLIPGTSSGWDRWRVGAPLDAGGKRLLEAAATREQPYLSLDGTLAKERFRAALLPHWLDFWNESTDPDEFAARAAAALRAVATPESRKE